MNSSPTTAWPVIEISARGQRQPVARRVTGWPLTVGRAADADLVLTDPCVAPHHLRIAPDADGVLWVDVLDTRNGARHAGRHHAAGSRFAWQPGQPIGIGPLALELRGADAPLAPEQPWHRHSAGQGLLLAAGVLVVLALAAAGAWLGNDQPGQWLRALPLLLPSLLALLLLWSGGWALLGKLLTGHAQFLRHLGVVVVAYLAVEGVLQLAHAAAFAFSWPLLARFDRLLYLPIAALALWAHLRLATHAAPRRLGALVAALALTAAALPIALSWQQGQRLTDKLYMSDIYPPGWRRAAPESVDAFVAGARDLLAPLERRRNDRSDEVDGPVDELD